ncbi:hypothetical protein SAMN05421640_3034 [Ekhidna lutea]|uniref:Uncharacterized protein n=1 Tax=Ekhidna lutea TaxID=447679 RepID=A0A239L807_EKHLU|nr:hypothetical protein [Ekhidna lutea]SNT26420.1 hypothetical protein SAMN05421640_3034 [Ekhidna lutea]
MTEINQEQLDNYHSGQMSDAEMASFEKQLESDPALKAESDLQADIVGGLKEYRKLELKARLDAINVGPTWMEFVGQSALMKSMGGVIVASIIGTGIYFLGEKEDDVSNTDPITIDAPTNESIEYVWELGKDETPSQSNQLERPAIANNTDEKNTKPDPGEEEEVVSANQAITKEETIKPFKPSFEAPNAQDVADDSQFAASGLDDLPENTATATSNDPIDVETEISKSTVIKYKYYDGKLFLNGDFNKAPYEILEINSSKGRRIYVYYLGNYYTVSITDKLTTLPEVNDKEVIKELNLLRENK